MGEIPELTPRRILVIDDNRDIHEDFVKILGPKGDEDRELASLEAAVLSQTTPVHRHVNFALDFAFQGTDGLAKVVEAAETGRPYAVAFVDVRMPPGWDGIETLRRIWDTDPDIQAVICTAYADYSLESISEHLGWNDQWLVLKKPFDPIEAKQLAFCLSEKWRMARKMRARMTNLERMAEGRTAALMKSKALCSVVQEMLSEILIGVDENGILFAWNRRAEMVLGIEAHAALRRNLFELEIAWDRIALQSFMDHARKGEGPGVLQRLAYRSPEGKDGFLQVRWVSLPGESGGEAATLLLAEAFQD